MNKQKPPNIKPFNPLDKSNPGESAAKAILRQPVGTMPPESFFGAGIYAIYYVGYFPLYAEVTKLNRNNRYQWPLYVGKAVPAGARKGGFGMGADPGQVFHKRLSEHAPSIDQAKNIETNDFRRRYLVIDDIWIPFNLQTNY